MASSLGRPVLGKLRWNLGAFAILGNHDSWQDVTLVRRRLRRVGMTVIGNGWKQWMFAASR